MSEMTTVAMEAVDVPECPVCLQSYDGECTIPRVLACGHSACESCLLNLPQKIPQTFRCPACTVLVKYPPQGPSSLPKNIDLLRLINPSSPSQNSQKSRGNRKKAVDFVPRSWSDEFYSAWKDRVLPNDSVFLEDENEGESGCSSSLLCGWLREKQKVSILRVGSFRFDSNESAFNFSYTARIMNFLCGMKEEQRDELDLVLSVKKRGLCRVLGLWGNMEDRCFYFVSEKLNEFHLDESEDLGEDDLSYFSIIGLQICEAMIGLHKEGLIAGCLGFSCLKFDDFGNAYVDLFEVIDMGRDVCRYVTEEVGSNGKRIRFEEMGTLLSDLMKKDIYVSPEVLFELLYRKKIVEEGSSSKYPVLHSSDVWPLCCFLLRLLVGKQFIAELIDCLNSKVTNGSEEYSSDFSLFYTALMEKISFPFESKFGQKFVAAKQILCRCFNIDPWNRPLVTDLWKSIRELILGLQFNCTIKLDKTVSAKINGHCLVLGELCSIVGERSTEAEGHELKGIENGGGSEESRVDEDFLKGLLDGKVKSKVVQGHLDCITGLALGGGFLFSSSFDKTIHVWSLQDFSHLHTFKGHEHKVMALVYIDGADPLCVSADGGGAIFVWRASVPFGQEPLRKWYEPKDWRYSGIHALTFSDNGHLYTGSGDKTIKAWSLQDGTLVHTMNGHKSVVSTLVVNNGVLYSGSWDATVRLWSLSDHSLLTVLGEETAGTLTSVLSLAMYQNTLVVAYENGTIKVWRNDVFMESMQIHSAAIFTVGMEGKWLFTGGWDKTVNVQELTGDEIQIDYRLIGSIPGASVITSLLYTQSKLFVGYADRSIRVYYYGS